VGWWLREVLKVVWGVGVWCREWPAAVTFFVVFFTITYCHIARNRKILRRVARSRIKMRHVAKFCDMSYATYDMSHATYDMSHATCDMS
jgi:type II secretory pathway component PulF